MDPGLSEIPTFVVVGDVNHGKSSVVATLAENDEVRISDRPGETRVCQRIAFEDLFVFYDTPGFQNAREALAALEPARTAAAPLEIFRGFVAQHAQHPQFTAECQLLRPILDGAGVIYVINGSEPIRPRYEAEMEILRLTGRLHLAIINCHQVSTHMAAWRERLQQYCAVREFNALYATFADRISLLKTLAHREQGWQPKLETAIRRLETQWEQRLDQCASILSDLLRECLPHAEHEAEETGSDAPQRQRTRLEQRYREAIARKENRAHRELLEVFRHRLVSTEAGVFDADLFSDRTWRLLGLTTRQIATLAGLVGGVAGAKVGAVVDLAAGGASVLLGTVLGGATGGAAGVGGALWMGKKAPSLQVPIPRWLRKFTPWKQRSQSQVAGAEARVTCRSTDFPWILLDRAIGVFFHVCNRAHARRDAVKIEIGSTRDALRAVGLATTQWPNDVRRECMRLFLTLREGEDQSADRTRLREVLRARLAALSTKPMPLLIEPSAEPNGR